MLNNTGKLPRDVTGEALQEFPPAFLAKARYASENSSASSVITLTDNTTSLEITAIGNSAVMRWIATSDTAASVVSAASGANFDHVIPSGQYRKFAVPRENAAASPASAQGVNRAEGLYQRVAIKSIGTASVLTVEYGQD